MRIALAVVLLAALLPAFAPAQTTISVGQGGAYDFTSIREAMDTATTGSTVIVYPGTYAEHVEFGGKDLILRSSNPLDRETVKTTVIQNTVSFSGGETDKCVLSGFTVTGGEGIRGDYYNGNKARIEYCRVIQTGGGIYDCDGIIQNNRILENSGFCLLRCDGLIRNNLIAGNSYEAAALNGTIQNNTFVDNGIGFYANFHGTVVNCILWAYNPTDIGYSPDPVYSCIKGWIGAGKGNITDDPQFVDPDGPDDDPSTYEDNDYRLVAGSPCIDAGINIYWSNWPIRDVDNGARIVGARVDMGCYEFAGSYDSDGDMLSDDDELAAGTQPDNIDTDGDDLVDGLERVRGTDPSAPNPPAVLNVPADFPTIQEAIVVTARAEEVVVAPGTYNGQVRFYGKNTTVRSQNPLDKATVEATILNGMSAPAVLFDGTETEECTLSGFSITNGYPGILGNCTRATIQHNYIYGNGGAYGAGIKYCDGIIRDNRITGNRSWPGGGGGLYRCHGLIEGNTITHNTADTWLWKRAGGQGGGLLHCNGTIQNNIISSNSVIGYFGAAGGGIAFCNGLIQSNVIAGNGVGSTGPAPYCSGGGLYGCSGRIQNNTIEGNRVSSLSGWGTGGGLYACNGPVENCVIWGNITDAPAAFLDQVDGGSSPTYSCIQDWIFGGTGNIIDDPLLTSASLLSYYLSTDSPCIDAGNSDPDQNDASGPPGQGTVRNDMGAYGGPQNSGWPVAGLPAVDLTGTFLAPTPCPIVAGQPIAFNGQIVNQGALDMASSVWIEFWVENARTGWRGLMCDSVFLGPLGAGEKFYLTSVTSRIVYDDLPAGYYALELKIDAASTLLESDKTNNIIRVEPCEIRQENRPNLLPAGFDFNAQPLNPAGGDTIELTATIANRGSQPTDGPFWIEFHVWPNAQFDVAGPFLCDSFRMEHPLAAGESMTLNLTPSVYALPEGEYFVGIDVDAAHTIIEENEDDNTTWLTGKKITVGSRQTGARNWPLYR